MCDIGFMRAQAGYPPRFAYVGDPEYSLFKGAVAKNLVLCELLSHGISDVAYWTDGHLEVDFVLSVDGSNCPIEVNVETTIGTASLDGCIDGFHPKRAFVVSMNPCSDRGIVSCIPPYDVGAIAEPTQEPGPRRSRPARPSYSPGMPRSPRTTGTGSLCSGRNSLWRSSEGAVLRVHRCGDAPGRGGRGYPERGVLRRYGRVDLSFSVNSGPPSFHGDSNGIHRGKQHFRQPV